MDRALEIPKKLPHIPDYQSLCSLLAGLIENLELYLGRLKDENHLPIQLDRLKLTGHSIVTLDRCNAVANVKIEIVDKTLSSLRIINKHVNGSRFDCLIGLFESVITRSLQDIARQLDALDSGYRSPYDWTSICDNLLKSLDAKSNVTTGEVEALLGLASKELLTVKGSSHMEESQKTLITIYADKLNVLSAELSSVNKETGVRLKQKAKKLRDIVDGTRLIMKNAFEMVNVLKSTDWINESDEIFKTINEKGADSLEDVTDYLEKIKTNWVGLQIDNETQKVCRLATLRVFNVHLKQIKKLSAIKSQLETSWVILGLKNITNNFIQTRLKASDIYNHAYYLTHKAFPKPTVDVPEGFIRDDEIYKELNTDSIHGLLVVSIHFRQYLQYLDSLTWNQFQTRKPREVCEDFMLWFKLTIEASVASQLDDDELQAISFDLADRLCLTKAKIATDRDALEYRLFAYKPKKPFKFEELQKIFQRRCYKRSLIDRYLRENFDEMVNSLKKKVVNRGQMILAKRAMDMMKRAIYSFKILRTDCLRNNDYYLGDSMMQQFSNEFCYAFETANRLLNSFRPNRRIPFSFKASGKFTKQIESSGLGAKDDFESEVTSLIERLKRLIKEEEADLEPVKDRKTQLRYLTSILNRSKLIPINELELTEQDEVEILKEIVEEFEFTMLTYGPVNGS